MKMRIENDPLDRQLKQTLKAWASRVHPPSDASARMLWEAARSPIEPPAVEKPPQWALSFSRHAYMEDYNGFHGVVMQALVQVSQWNLIKAI